MKSSWQSYGSKGNWMRVFSQVPVHFATLLGFSICLGGGGGGDAARRGFFAAGFFGGAAGMRSSVAPLLMFVMRRAGAFLAAGLREGHCGGAPPPLLPYMLAALKSNFAHHSLYGRSGAFLGAGRFYRVSCFISASASIMRVQMAAIMGQKPAARRLI